jgi:hypothetical protein
MAGTADAPNSSIGVQVVMAPPLLTRREATSALIVAGVSAVCSAGLCAAAVLLHPPAGVIPFLVTACAGCPVYGTWRLPHAIAAVRFRRATGTRATIARFRRSLEQVPEVDHPLGH